MTDPLLQAPVQPYTRLGVLLFTDIVGSTELKRPERLGDVGYRRLLDRHNELFEQGLAEIPRASLLLHTGDGYFAEFATASDAVSFALLFQKQMRLEPWGDVPLETRVGIHGGEYLVTEEGGTRQIIGQVADLAARITSLGLGGQILMTRQVFNDARQYVGRNTAILGDDLNIVWVEHGPYLPRGGDMLDVCEVGFKGLSPFQAPPSSEKIRRVIPSGEEEMFGPGYPRPSAGLQVPGKPNWILVQRVGEGGFGEVWLAENEKLRSRHVFKFCFNASRLRALRREFTIFRLLKEALGERDDIAKLFDYRVPDEWGDGQPPYYLESEYAAGGDLGTWLASFPGGLPALPEADRLAIIAGAAEAVAAAHSVGVLHKDIKPGNILLRYPPGLQPPKPVLADFGIGSVANRAALNQFHITQVGFTATTEQREAGSTRAGTRLYISPESLGGAEFTTQSDIYALGVLLYQIIVGDLARPLTPEWRSDITDEVLLEDIGAATARDPAARPGPGELAQRLRNVPARRAQREDAIVAQRRHAAEERERRIIEQLRRRRRVVIRGAIVIVGVFALAAVAGSAKYISDLRREQQNTSAALQEAKRQTATAELRLADGLVLQGDAQGLAGRWGEAKRDYWQAFRRFNELKVSSFRSEAALLNAYEASPPALLTFTGHDGPVESLTIAPDGKTVLSCGDDHTIKVWDIQTGSEIRSLVGHTDVVRSAMVSADGRTAISGSNDCTIKVWDLTTGKEVRTLVGHLDRIVAVAISRDARTAVSASADGTLKVWDLVAGKGTHTLTGHTGVVTSVEISADGLTALSGSWDATLKLWDLLSGKEIRSFVGHGTGVLSVAITPDGHAALSGSVDKTLKLWDLSTGKEIRTFPGHAGIIKRVAVTPDGARALSASGDKTIKLWDLNTGAELRTLSEHTNSVTGIAFIEGGSMAISSSEDGSLKLWDLAGSREVRTLRGHTDAVLSVAMNADGRTALSGSSDKTVKLWDTVAGKEIRTLVGHTGPVRGVAFGLNLTAVSCSEDSTIKLWDLTTGDPIRTFTGHAQAVSSAALSRDGRTLLSGSWDGTIRFWDAATGATIRALTAHTKRVTCVGFSPDGQLALSCSNDGAIKIWNLAQAQRSMKFTSRNGGVLSAVFSHDSKTVLSAGEDNTLELWDVATGKQLRTFTGHTAPARCVFNPSGDIALSGSYDNTLKLWDVNTGKEIHNLTGHTDSVFSVAYSPDGRTALSGSRDRTVKVWDLSRAVRHNEFQRTVPQAQLTLQQSSNDPAALQVIGEWYAFRGMNRWAVELLTRARAAGAPIDPQMLASCYWALADEPPRETKPDRDETLASAQNAYAAALATTSDDASRGYLALRVSAVERAATRPTTSPSSAPR